MKKTYISPKLISVNVRTASHLLVDSGTRGLTVDYNQEVTTNFVKENRSSRSSYNVWDDDWSN